MKKSILMLIMLFAISQVSFSQENDVFGKLELSRPPVKIQFTEIKIGQETKEGLSVKEDLNFPGNKILYLDNTALFGCTAEEKVFYAVNQGKYRIESYDIESGKTVDHTASSWHIIVYSDNHQVLFIEDCSGSILRSQALGEGTTLKSIEYNSGYEYNYWEQAKAYSISAENDLLGRIRNNYSKRAGK